MTLRICFTLLDISAELRQPSILWLTVWPAFLGKWALSMLSSAPWGHQAPWHLSQPELSWLGKGELLPVVTFGVCWGLSQLLLCPGVTVEAHITPLALHGSGCVAFPCSSSFPSHGSTCQWGCYCSPPVAWGYLPLLPCDNEYHPMHTQHSQSGSLWHENYVTTWCQHRTLQNPAQKCRSADFYFLKKLFTFHKPKTYAN